MGGLVVKLAYNLASQMPIYQRLAIRIKAMFFLATPHGGSELADILSSIIRVFYASRPYVKDLKRNSLATQSINEEFRQHCYGLQLRSFYESRALKIGFQEVLIVPKDNAVLGYTNERPTPLDGDHRSICKYATLEDSNYRALRDALANTVRDLRDTVSEPQGKSGEELQTKLDDFLGVTGPPEDDLFSVNSQRIAESCRWLPRKPEYQDWLRQSHPQIFWLRAQPATGKSVACGYAINDLQRMEEKCCYYFFRRGDQPMSTISSFLTSMAWQMASFYPKVRDVVFQVCEKHGNICRSADYRTIWQKLWVDGILKLELCTRSFWMIDALEECRLQQELAQYLARIQETSTAAIRIFVTCRNSSTFHRLRPEQVIDQGILESDTQDDIKKYLFAHRDEIPAGSDNERDSIMADILGKSAGCFLWVSLILRKIGSASGIDAVRDALEETPAGMDELYTTIAESMSSKDKPLAAPIVTWAVCAIRPLSTGELRGALQLQLNSKISDISQAISKNCQELVYIDRQGRVRILHDSAREFLLRDDASLMAPTFFVDRQEGHKTLALTCLDYLNSDEMMKKGRIRSLSATKPEKSPFLNYAARALYEHLNRAPSTDDEILTRLAQFLQSKNILSCIEHLSNGADLDTLLKTGQSLRTFLRRRSKTNLLLGKEVVVVDSWSTDLVRLVTKFGKQLLSHPMSIYDLIPPFCPFDTAPYSQFASHGRMGRLDVVGLSDQMWDDCLCTITLSTEISDKGEQKPEGRVSSVKERFLSLASSESYFCIGTSSGRVVIHNDKTCLEEGVMSHGQAVRELLFATNTPTLVSASNRLIRVWDTNTWLQKWEFPLSKECISMAFFDNDRLLLAALRDNKIVIFNLLSGSEQQPINWANGLSVRYGNDLARGYSRAAAFNVEHKLLAIVYRGYDIVVWDIEEDKYHLYNRQHGLLPERKVHPNVQVDCLAFSRLPSMSLLAAKYDICELVLFDTLAGTVKARAGAETNCTELVSSTDGRTLAGVDTSGTIELWDFETLRVLYRIKAQDHGISALCFSADSSRLLDIRGSGQQCRIWDPTVLYRRETEGDSNRSPLASKTAQSPSTISRLEPQIELCSGTVRTLPVLITTIPV